MYKYEEISAVYNKESSYRPHAFSLCDVKDMKPIAELYYPRPYGNAYHIQIYLIVDSVPYPIISHSDNIYMFSFEFNTLVPEIEDGSIITVYYSSDARYANTFHRIFFRRTKSRMFQYTTLEEFYKYNNNEYLHLIFCCIVYEFDFYMKELLADEFTHKQIIKMTLEKQLPNKYVKVSDDVRKIVDVTLNTNHRM